VAGCITCKNANLFEAFACPWPPSSTFYKLLEIERTRSCHPWYGLTGHMRVVLWYALLGHEVVARKTMYREVSPPAFAYGQQQNRLALPDTVGCLTPAPPEERDTWQARCDICKEMICTLAPNSASTSALVVKAR
jgi:hypothetical protein